MGNSDLTQIIKNILTEIELLKTQNKIINLTFASGTTLVVPVFTADPATYSNGQLWYNSTSNLFKYVEGGTIKVFGGGSVSWGGIGGTLSNQTDLQSALNVKSNTGHTHVEADITDLGAYLTDITGEPLGDLSNVVLASPVANNILQYNGSNWVNVAKEYGSFHCYTGGATGIAGTATVLVLDRTKVNSNTSVFSLSSNELTVNKAGNYLIVANTSLVDPGTERTEYDFWLQVDTGSGFGNVTGAKALIYSRAYSTGSSGTVSIILPMAAGDKLRLQVLRSTGAGTVSQENNSTSLIIREM